MSSGKAHRTWIIQRLTALLLIPLTIWFLFSLLQVLPLGYTEAREWLASPFNSILFGVFMIILYHHGWVGMREVIEDYVHQPALKRVSLIILMLAAILLLTISLHSLFSLHL